MHFPTTAESQSQARKRLAFEELLVLQLAVLANRVPEQAEGISRSLESGFLPEFQGALPFSLTNAQVRVIQEIFQDLADTRPMTRLVQGDVGSGKTLVAAAALFMNFKAGLQGALMAPTEILASQHFHGLAPIFAKLGIRTALLMGETSGKERKRILQELAGGRMDFLIGTHALFQ